MQEYKITTDAGRMDSYLAQLLGFSRSKVVKMIDNGLIMVNGEVVKASYQLKENDSVTVEEYVEEENKRLVYGSFDVFYGPIYDNAGKLRVDEGENLSDIVLLTEFDWFVDGVILDNE